MVANWQLGGSISVSLSCDCEHVNKVPFLVSPNMRFFDQVHEINFVISLMHQ